MGGLAIGVEAATTAQDLIDLLAIEVEAAVGGVCERRVSQTARQPRGWAWWGRSP
jgi:hypothetical protein